MTFDLGGRAAGATTAELRTAAALRWQRPLLTAELAEQACARAVADGDDLRWLQAAGWLLDGHAAGGDARDVATAVVAGVTGHVNPGDSTVPVPLRAPGTEVLTRPEGARLRVELAGVAQADGELEAARALVVGLPDDAPGEDQGLLRLDRLAVEVRCALAGASAAELERLRSDVDACGSGFGGEPAAYADLVVGSVHRARREHDAAVDRALRGLAQLGWTPERPGSRPLSTHLAAALLSQWITALLDSGHVPPDAVAAAAVQRDAGDAGRQGVLLRLTLARVQAGRADHAARALVEAETAATAPNRRASPRWLQPAEPPSPSCTRARAGTARPSRRCGPRWRPTRSIATAGRASAPRWRRYCRSPPSAPAPPSDPPRSRARAERRPYPPSVRLRPEAPSPVLRRAGPVSVPGTASVAVRRNRGSPRPAPAVRSRPPAGTSEAETTLPPGRPSRNARSVPGPTAPPEPATPSPSTIARPTIGPGPTGPPPR
ncbi:hypothetical protein [Pseudonocardia sp. ICBG162]|uniref:hypothetical protein n=1 Tax=Pseudonocardia sp. ICBG162 TaxID=2846761 RepID=UPI001CF666D7|nr:hypothetical protein [Pseudonocardia sp. ICBG162]